MKVKPATEPSAQPKDAGRAANNAKNGKPARHGQSWGEEEDGALRAGFFAGETVRALAKTHQRKRGAIRSRLVKLGLMEDVDEVIRF